MPFPVLNKQYPGYIKLSLVVLCGGLILIFPLIAKAQSNRLTDSKAETTIDTSGDQWAEKPGSTLHEVRERLRGSALTLGVGIVTTKFSLSRDKKFENGTTPIADMTDNGRITWLLDYQTGESYLLEVPLQIGDFKLGYNSIFKLSQFSLDRQTVSDTNDGEDLGTHVSGYLFGVAPELFMLLGPLYRERDIFWKAGLGIGGGLIQYKADVIFRNSGTSETSRETVTGGLNQLNPFFHIFWVLEWEKLKINYQLYQLEGNTENGYFVFMETSFAISYKVEF